jgi:hypothetical protein
MNFGALAATEKNKIIHETTPHIFCKIYLEEHLI